MRGSRELIFRTSRTSWLRYAEEVDTRFYAGPFRQIEAILSEERSAYPRIGPHIHTESCPFTQLSLVAKLPVQMANRLFDYVKTRLNGENLPSGSCYEFVSFMAGYDDSRQRATRRVNEFFSTSERLPEPDDEKIEVPVGDIVLLAHPDHLAVGFKDEQDRRDPEYSAAGHGPLRIQHACLSVGNIEGTLGKGDSWAIHRVSMNGALAIDPMPDILRGYRAYLDSHYSDIWEGGQAPQPEDLHLYRVT